MPPRISEPAQMENPFWAFSLKVYGHKGVKDACLALQDRFGADVNILLFLCWRNSIGLPDPTAGRIQDMMEAIATINRDVIAPLRKIRTILPGKDMAGAPETRKKVLEAELSAEQMAQATLFSAFPAPTPPPSPESEEKTVHTALVLYFRALGIGETGLDEARPLLSALADGVYA